MSDNNRFIIASAKFANWWMFRFRPGVKMYVKKLRSIKKLIINKLPIERLKSFGKSIVKMFMILFMWAFFVNAMTFHIGYKVAGIAYDNHVFSPYSIGEQSLCFFILAVTVIVAAISFVCNVYLIGHNIIEPYFQHVHSVRKKLINHK